MKTYNELRISKIEYTTFRADAITHGEGVKAASEAQKVTAARVVMTLVCWLANRWHDELSTAEWLTKARVAVNAEWNTADKAKDGLTRVRSKIDSVRKDILLCGMPVWSELIQSSKRIKIDNDGNDVIVVDRLALTAAFTEYVKTRKAEIKAETEKAALDNANAAAVARAAETQAAIDKALEEYKATLKVKVKK